MALPDFSGIDLGGAGKGLKDVAMTGAGYNGQLATTMGGPGNDFKSQDMAKDQARGGDNAYLGA